MRGLEEKLDDISTKLDSLIWLSFFIFRRTELMSDALSTEIAALTAAHDKLAAAVTALTTFMQGLPAQFNAAIAAAQGAGATPEQLAAIHSAVADMNAMADTITADAATALPGGTVANPGTVTPGSPTVTVG